MRASAFPSAAYPVTGTFSKTNFFLFTTAKINDVQATEFINKTDFFAK
jgi:hypothetical protein